MLRQRHAVSSACRRPGDSLPGRRLALRDERRPRRAPGRTRCCEEEVLGRDTTDVWAARLTDVEVPAGKIGSVDSAFDLATSLDLDPIVSFGDESCSQVRHPITYSATPVTRYQPPPRLGADSVEVRHWLSG